MFFKKITKFFCDILNCCNDNKRKQYIEPYFFMKYMCMYDIYVSCLSTEYKQKCLTTVGLTTCVVLKCLSS